MIQVGLIEYRCSRRWPSALVSDDERSHRVGRQCVGIVRRHWTIKQGLAEAMMKLGGWFTRNVLAIGSGDKPTGGMAGQRT